MGLLGGIGGPSSSSSCGRLVGSVVGVGLGWASRQQQTLLSVEQLQQGVLASSTGVSVDSGRDGQPARIVWREGLLQLAARQPAAQQSNAATGEWHVRQLQQQPVHQPRQ